MSDTIVCNCTESEVENIKVDGDNKEVEKVSEEDTISYEVDLETTLHTFL
ncbi:hypothetical protein [Terrisporobacter sp.]